MTATKSKAERDEAQALLDLLAWLYLQTAKPRPVRDPQNWPAGVWVSDSPKLWRIAMSDPLLFDLARYQVAADNSLKLRPNLPPEEREFIRHLSSELNIAPRPQAAGRAPGRRAISDIICALFDGFSRGCAAEEEKAQAASVAHAINDSLNQHQTLSDHPEVVPSAEAIRKVLARHRG